MSARACERGGHGRPRQGRPRQRGLTLVALMRPAPPAPWLPKERHGTPIVTLLACHTGNPDEGEKAVAPIKSFGKPIGDVLIRRTYVQMQSLLDATQPKGRRYYWKSEYLPRIEPALSDQVLEHAARIRSPVNLMSDFYNTFCR